MDVHELKYLGTDLIKLLQLNFSQQLDVLVAPLLLSAIVHRLGLAQFILHRADNVLRNLAHVNSCLHIFIGSFAPLRDERV